MPPLADAKELSDVYGEKLKRSLYKSISKGLLDHVPEGLKEAVKAHFLPPLDKAREARNRIAHEFLFGVEGLDLASSSFIDLANSLRQNVRLIADAGYSVCCIVRGFNKDPAPCCRERYVREVVQWVMEPSSVLLTVDRHP
jgi:hypothetical protein